jgi:transposase
MKVIVGNAANMKGLRGRKTDKSDAEWIARKVRDDEIIPSFIPAPEVRETRDFYRLRCSLVKQKVQIRLGILKLLNASGIPLSTVLEDVFGVTGMGILQAMANGESSWAQLKFLVKGKAKANLEAIRLVLEQPMTASSRWALAFQLERLKRLDEDLAKVDVEIDHRLEPHETLRLALMTIPGFGRGSAGQLLAELGTDLGDFPDPDHFAAWLGLVPGNNQTGGRSKPAPTRKGNRYLRSLLVECAHAASRTNGCWLQAKFQALQKRMPYNKATVAIAHKLAMIVYRVIKDGAVYQDHGGTFTPSQSKSLAIARAIKLIKAQGGQVVLPEHFPDIPVRPQGRPRKSTTEPNPTPTSG